MQRRSILILFALALLVGAGAARAIGQDARNAQCGSRTPSCFELRSTIALSSNRDNPAGTAHAAEIYLMNPDGGDVRRLTDDVWGDAFANLAPDGKKIVFDSARMSHAVNDSDLFLMSSDGSDQTWLTHGSSATWSPDGKQIAFHTSASGTGLPIRNDPGSATTDSDIFAVNVDDLLLGIAAPTNVTNSPSKIDDDADWSPDGGTLVYTAHDVLDPNHNNPLSAEIYVLNADGSGSPTQLTFNAEEERAPAWSPDGTRIVFSCRRGGPDFEICVMNSDGTGQVQLTDDAFGDLTATWSPEGDKILFHKNKPLTPDGGPQLWVMNADGTEQTQLTFPPGASRLANWGVLRVHVKA